MAAKNYESPDLRVIEDDILGIGLPGSVTDPVQKSQLTFSVWKNMTGLSNASYDDYVAWMNQNGYGAYIQDEKY